MRTFRFVLLCLAAILAPVASAQAETPPPSAEDREILARAEAYLTAIRTMEARFVQISSNGALAEGSVTIMRPGRMRLDYDPPTPIRILADGTWLIYIDTELDQVSHLSLSSTPAGILLRDTTSFSDQDIIVQDVRRAASVIEIDTALARDPSAGTLTLVFTDDPLELRQWRLRDGQNIETAVSLFNMRTGMELNRQDFFHVAPGFDPMRNPQ